MCNLYSVKTSRAALARKFMLSDNRMAAFEPVSAIFPGYLAPIIKQSADGERELVMRGWGFILLRDGYAPKRVTNTRDDKIDTKSVLVGDCTRKLIYSTHPQSDPAVATPRYWLMRSGLAPTSD